MDGVMTQIRSARSWTFGVFMGVGAALSAVSYSNSSYAALPSIPLNSKLGSLEIPLSCDFPIVGAQTVQLQMTGTVQNNLAPGQTFYLSDATGTMVIPKAVVNLSVMFLRAASTSGTIDDMEMLGVNAYPASMNAFETPVSFGPVNLVKGQTAKVSLPNSGFMQIGPFTAGSAGTAMLQLGAAHTNITLFTAGGKQIGSKPLSVQCSAPNPSVNLVSMTVSGAASTAVAQPHSGITSAAFTPAMNTQVGVLHYAASCTIDALIHETVDVTLSGTVPTGLKPNSQFYINNAAGQLHLPSDAVNLLMTLLPLTTAIGGTVQDFEIRASNTTQGSVNAAKSAITMGGASVSRNHDATLAIPSSGLLTIGPFTTSASGAITDVTIGQTSGMLSTSMGSIPGIPLAFSCAAPNPAVNMVSVNISN